MACEEFPYAPEVVQFSQHIEERVILPTVEFITCSYLVHQKMEIFHKPCDLNED